MGSGRKKWYSPAHGNQPVGSAGEEGMVRFVDRVNVNGYATGTLQVFCEGAWGAVCSLNFDDRDAQVACRQLGFPSGMNLPRESGFGTTRPDLPEVCLHRRCIQCRACMVHL